MAFIDYYKIMGIAKDTPQKDIRKAYMKRAKQFHPDLHPDDPKAKAKFQALNEAYNVLGDPEKRKKYDQYGENWENAEAFSGRGGFGSAGAGEEGFGFGGFDFSQFSGGGGFSSFFENLFGSRRGTHSGCGCGGHGGCNADSDTHATVNLDIYTAMLGGDVVVQTPSGKFKLHIKPLTQQGTKVRLKGKGQAQSGGTAGDLIISYNVTLPSALNARQRELLEQMRGAAG